VCDFATTVTCRMEKLELSLLDCTCKNISRAEALLEVSLPKLKVACSVNSRGMSVELSSFWLW